MWWMLVTVLLLGTSLLATMAGRRAALRGRAARFAVLGFMARIGRPIYGLEVIEAGLASHAQAYVVLRTLEWLGLVDSFESEPLPERGGRRRRYYRLTEEGRVAAQAAAR